MNLNRRTNRLAATMLLLAAVETFSPNLSAGSNAVETSGDILLGIIPAAALGATVYKNDCEGSWQLFEGFLANQVVTQGLKYTVHKDRPDDSDDHSFPSGHTSTTFQAAAFLHKRYGLTWGLPAYFGAAYTGWTRVDSDKHYVEDVLAGAVIGTISSFYFTEPLSKKTVTVTPAASHDSFGITLTARW